MFIVPMHTEVDMGVIPLLLPEQVKSGLSNKVLQHMLSLRTTTDRHLNYVVNTWPGRVPNAYDASQIKLLDVAKYAENTRTYARLFFLGLEVKEENIFDLVRIFKDSKQCALCLELVINQIRVTQQEVDLKSYLDRACTRAIDNCKLYLVVCLMEHGATPPRSHLRQCIEKGSRLQSLQDHPLIEKYLAEEVNYPGMDMEGLESSQVIVTNTACTHHQLHTHIHITPPTHKHQRRSDTT